MPRKQPLYPHVPKSRKHQEIPSTEATPFERDIIEAKKLISQALDVLTVSPALAPLTMDDFDSALWRLVDAAGLTARYAATTAVGTPTNPTGRGYFIEQT